MLDALGRAYVLLLVLLLAGGLVLLNRSAQPSADLVVWTFDPAEHAVMTQRIDGEPSLVDRFEEQTGKSVRVELLSRRAMDLRLETLAAANSKNVPDLVQIERTGAFRFLGENGPLLPLDRFLDANGWGDRVHPARLSSWQADGQSFGVPVGLNATTLTFRRDLWEAADLDPTAARTWDELADASRRLVAYWQQHGRPFLRPMELSTTSSEHLVLMLQQRGLDLLDATGRPTLDDPRVLDTIDTYLALLKAGAGPSTPSAAGRAGWARDLALSDVALVWTPDWRLAELEQTAPQLAGNVTMMPLPRFTPADAPTATWGGTMVAIPRTAADPDVSWRLLKTLVLSDAALAARQQITHVRPARIDGPGTDLPTDFFAGPPPGALYTDLANDIRPQPPAAGEAVVAAHLARVLARAIEQRDLPADVRRQRLETWLSEAQVEAQRRLKFVRSSKG